MAVKGLAVFVKIFSRSQESKSNNGGLKIPMFNLDFQLRLYFVDVRMNFRIFA